MRTKFNVEKNSGASAPAAGKKNGASAAAAKKKSGASAAASEKKNGASAAAAKKKSGASAAASEKKNGASATPAEKKPGASAAASEKKNGASAAAAKKKSGASAAPAEKKPGASAAPAEKNDVCLATPVRNHSDKLSSEEKRELQFSDSDEDLADSDEVIHHLNSIRLRNQMSTTRNVENGDIFADLFDDLSAAITEVVDNSVGWERSVERVHGLKKARTLGQIFNWKTKRNSTSFELFSMTISPLELYPEAGFVDTLLRDLAEEKIVTIHGGLNNGAFRLPCDCGASSVVDSARMGASITKQPLVYGESDWGTELKLLLNFENGMKALMKPMRYPREEEMNPDHFYFDDFERHNAEVAAFYLDRILGFRRVPPTTGRKFNVTSEIYELAPLPLLKTFFMSPAENLCFHGTCDYYCDTAHAFCGHPDIIEGSVAVLLPSEKIAHRQTMENPWRRSYSCNSKAKWETDDSYCDKVRKKPEYNASRLLNDVMDMTILDFLIGNEDRHHYEVFDMFETTDGDYPKSVCPVHLDQGRAFGRPHIDNMIILTPLIHCCQIRVTTLNRLLKFHQHSPHLGDSLMEAMINDPIHPVLLQKHAAALDRRLHIILETIRKCIQRRGVDN
ncbi:unnamed protein product, partial [Cyprideis torosa]